MLYHGIIWFGLFISVLQKDGNLPEKQFCFIKPTDGFINQEKLYIKSST